MAEYIEREALIVEYDRIHIGPAGGARKLMVDAPAADVVSRSVFEQVKWERDIAMEQLKDHKIPFGCIAPDVVEVVRKAVKGYEGYYEVDQFGRVYSVDRVISVNDNGRQYEKPLKVKQMKQSMHTKGYKTVALTKDGNTKTCYVHRLVAEAFVDNPCGLPFINHKDEDKTNNFADNLEWCTNEYNINYGTARKRQSRALKGKKHTKEHNEKISKGVKAYFCSYGERKE